MNQTTSPAARIGANVRAELARRSITQAQLAEHLGLGNASMSGRINGAIALDVNELDKIARFLGLTPADLL